ncbi:MAG: ribbon-helix-helix protein, CopG family [bacterium]
MKRTQIYLDETIFDFLKKESKVEHKSISEIIRESIKKRMDNRRDDIIRRMESVFGIWKNRELDVNEYITNLRKDRKL